MGSVGENGKSFVGNNSVGSIAEVGIGSIVEVGKGSGIEIGTDDNSEDVVVCLDALSARAISPASS